MSGELHHTEHWRVTSVCPALPGTRVHVVLSPRQFVGDLADLPAEVGADFWLALAWVRAEFRLTFYGLVLRDSRAGPVVEVVVGAGDVDPGHVGVRVEIGG